MSAAGLTLWMWGIGFTAFLVANTINFRRRARLLGPVAWAPFVVLALSYLLANLFVLFPANPGAEPQARVAHAVGLWQSHIALLLIVYGTLAVALRTEYVVNLVIALLVGLFSLWIAADPPEMVRTQKIAEFFALSAVAVIGLLCLVAIPRWYTIAIVLWSVLVLGEWFAAFWYYECQLGPTIDLARGTGKSCERYFGPVGWYLEPLAMAPFWGFALWAMWRWFNPRRS